MKTLTEIHLEKKLISPPYYCDKEIFPHNYLSQIYDKYLPPYKDKKINLLEVGVQHGGSLLLWREYFTQSYVYGIDVKDVRAEDTKTLRNVFFILDNAYCVETTSRLPCFDIIIDDASHHINHQKYLVQNYYNLLHNDGIMIIEDIASKDYLEELANSASEQGYKTIIKHDMAEEMRRWDNIVLVLKKTNNDILTL
jgi:SAM-dependent methyltransferase